MLLLALITALTTLLIACGTSSEGGAASNIAEPIEVSPEEIVSGELEIIASNWEFDKEYYAIKAGEPINVTVNSLDGVHGIEIRDTAYTNIINNKTTEVTIDKPGTYSIICSIPCGTGHRTMVSKLVVVEA